MLTENDFASIKTMIDSAVGEIGQALITGPVVKRDPANKLVWIAELGDQPIPVVDFNRMVDVYSFNAADEDWHTVAATGEPAFVSPWSNFDSGTVLRPAQFKKDPLGWVHIRGLVKSGTTGAAGQTIFTLPVGYRPYAIGSPPGVGDSTGLEFPTMCWTGAATVFGSVTVVGSTGTLQTYQSNVYGAGTGLWLNGIHFQAAPPQTQKRSENSTFITPALGDTIVVALERGTRRLPRCLGVIQSTDYIRPGDD